MSVAYDFTPETAAGEFLRKPHQLLIDGHRVPSSSGRTFKSLNPATEEVIATIAEGNEADVNRAVAAARRAWDETLRKEVYTHHEGEAMSQGELIEARGEVVRAGGSMVFIRGLVTAEGRPILTFSAIVKKVRRKG